MFIRINRSAEFSSDSSDALDSGLDTGADADGMETSDMETASDLDGILDSEADADSIEDSGIDFSDALDTTEENTEITEADPELVEALLTEAPNETEPDLSSVEMGDFDGMLEVSHEDTEALQDEPGEMPALDASDIATVEDISQWVSDVNPNYDPFDYNSPYCNNCGSCALAVEQKLSGMELTEASAENIGTIEEMNNQSGMEQMKMDWPDIENYLKFEGPGSHGIVGIDRVDGPGHWFNAYYDGNKVVAIDGQTGTISDWPPDQYGSIKNMDFSVKKKAS